MDVRIYDDADNVSELPALVYDCHGNIFLATIGGYIPDSTTYKTNLVCLGYALLQGWPNSHENVISVGDRFSVENLGDFKKFNGTLTMRN